MVNVFCLFVLLMDSNSQTCSISASLNTNRLRAETRTLPVQKISSLVPRFCIYVRVSVDGDYTLPAPPQTKLATGYSMGLLSGFTRFCIGSSYPILYCLWLSCYFRSSPFYSFFIRTRQAWLDFSVHLSLFSTLPGLKCSRR